MFIVYELDRWSRDLNTNFTLKYCLFGVDHDKYVYTGYSIGFDSHSEFSLPDGSIDKNVIIFGVDMSLSVHIYNKEKDISFLGIGPTKGLDDTTLTSEAQYSINFSRSNRKWCLSLHYNGSNSFVFVNATKRCQVLQKYKNMAKNSEIKPYPFCLGNISKDFTANSIKKTGLNGCVYDFPVEYIIDTSKIINIHKYLMKKHEIKQCLE